MSATRTSLRLALKVLPFIRRLFVLRARALARANFYAWARNGIRVVGLFVIPDNLGLAAVIV
ncbi:hypothetical protein EBR21_18270 [bacterium]|nr:hypothetical protein [bacterium]